MKKCEFKVIGTNSATKYLDGQTLNFGYINFSRKQSVFQVEFNDDSYLLDIKSVTFEPDGVFITAFLSDEKKNVGRVVMKYLS